MAIVYQGVELGYMYVKSNGEKCRVSLRRSNCLACWIYVYKEDGRIYHQLHDFWADEQHVKNIIKNGHKPLNEQDGLVSVHLNLFHKECSKILSILVKSGYEVRCFYKDSDEKKKSK